jgi:hypothetical protein
MNSNVIAINGAGPRNLRVQSPGRIRLDESWRAEGSGVADRPNVANDVLHSRRHNGTKRVLRKVPLWEADKIGAGQDRKRRFDQGRLSNPLHGEQKLSGTLLTSI